MYCESTHKISDLSNPVRVIENDIIIQVDWFDKSDTFHCFVIVKNTKDGFYTRATDNCYQMINYKGV